MKEMDEGYYAVLAADATLAGLAPGGVWRQLAPLDTPVPFVVFRQSAPDEDKYTMAGLAWRWVQYDAAVVDRSESADAALAALARVHTLLQEAETALTAEMTGYTVKRTRATRQADDHFIDQGGVPWQTVTRTYRSMVVPT